MKNTINVKKPITIVLGLALVLSAASIVTPDNLIEANAVIDIKNPNVYVGQQTIVVLDTLPGSVVAKGQRLDTDRLIGGVLSKVVLYTGDDLTLTGKLMTQNGNAVNGKQVNIYALTPTPEKRLIASAVTDDNGNFSTTWTVEPYFNTRVPQDTLQYSSSQTMTIYAQFEGNESFAPSKSAKTAVNVKSWDLIVDIVSDKNLYREGESASVVVNFFQGDRDAGIEYKDFVSPDAVKARFDGKVVELQKKKEGTYTFVVDDLSKEHHQLLVQSEKTGYNPGTEYLTLITAGLK